MSAQLRNQLLLANRREQKLQVELTKAQKEINRLGEELASLREELAEARKPKRTPAKRKTSQRSEPEADQLPEEPADDSSD